jgi:hypothetical protein
MASNGVISLDKFFESEPYKNPDAHRISELIPDAKIAFNGNIHNSACADEWMAMCIHMAETVNGLFLAHLADHIGSHPVIHLGCSPRHPRNSPVVNFVWETNSVYLGVNPRLASDYPLSPWDNIAKVIAPDGFDAMSLAYVNADPLDFLSLVPDGEYNFIVHPFYGAHVNRKYYVALNREIMRLCDKRSIVTGMLPELFDVMCNEQTPEDDQFALVQFGSTSPNSNSVYGATLRPYLACIEADTDVGLE